MGFEESLDALIATGTGDIMPLIYTLAACILIQAPPQLIILPLQSRLPIPHIIALPHIRLQHRRHPL